MSQFRIALYLGAVAAVSTAPGCSSSIGGLADDVDANHQPPADATISDPEQPGDDDDPVVPPVAGCLAGGTDYTVAGPYEVTTTPGPTDFSIFHPATLDANCEHPIVAWGNGTGVSGTSVYAHLNRHLASWGFVVIASHSSSVGSGAEHRQGLDYMLAENRRQGSLFYQALAPIAGVAGHSQGGIGASAAATHTAVRAEVNMQGGGSAGDRAALLLTGTEDFMSTSIHNSYAASTGPAFLASYTGADHIRTPTQLGQSSPGGIQYKRLYAAWFRCFLASDDVACNLFAGGPSCGLCGEPGWAETTSKNMPPL